jgi:prepilin-type N-terminal cleavage/methylation domain-containing protein
MKTARAFTIVELLVVVAIIGILASVVLATLSDARQRSFDTRRLADMSQVIRALDLYLDDTNVYPPHGGDTYGCDIGTCLAVLTDELVPNYLGAIPLDPVYGNISTNGYRYCRQNDPLQSGYRTTYTLMLWNNATNGWCAVETPSNISGTACWFVNGQPQFGWCGNEI